MSIFISMFIILGIQFAIRALLRFIGLPAIYIEMATDFALALLFSLWNYRGNKRFAFKDVYFHRDIAIYFAGLSVFTIIFQFVF